MRSAVRVGDPMEGTVPHHAMHIIGWETISVGEDETIEVPIYCSGHQVTGTQQTGSQNVFINNKAAARLGDRGHSTDPCDRSNYKNITGSINVFVNGRAMVAVNSRIRHTCGYGTGRLVRGSQNVHVGG